MDNFIEEKRILVRINHFKVCGLFILSSMLWSDKIVFVLVSNNCILRG